MQHHSNSAASMYTKYYYIIQGDYINVILIIFMQTDKLAPLLQTDLVKSGGTGVVTKDCMGFRCTCWNMRRISGLLEMSSLLLQEWSCEIRRSIRDVYSLFSFYASQTLLRGMQHSTVRVSKFSLTHLMLHFLQEGLKQLRLLGQGCLLAWWRGVQFYFQCCRLQEEISRHRVSVCVCLSIHSVDINISYDD